MIVACGSIIVYFGISVKCPLFRYNDENSLLA